MHIVNICFSPTGGTQRTADMLIQAMAARSTAIDLSDWQIPFSTLSLQEDDVAVIVVPSYGGRVPQPAVDRLSAINGNHARAILICVYGNRAVEDALVELQDTAEAAGFHVVAAISAIARHSIVHEIAAGRPDAQDQKTLSEFAGQIKKNWMHAIGLSQAFPAAVHIKTAAFQPCCPSLTNTARHAEHAQNAVRSRPSTEMILPGWMLISVFPACAVSLSVRTPQERQTKSISPLSAPC